MKLRMIYGASNLDDIFTIDGDILVECDKDATGTITIPNGVKIIGDHAFTFCKNIKNIVIPNGVTSIGDSAFLWCYGLTSVTLPDSVTSIGSNAFDCCKSLTSVKIPYGVTSIEHSTFYRCESLTSVTIPDSVTSIGNNAFESCINLTSITIPDSVTSIGGYAFTNCYNLTSVSMPSTGIEIASTAFSESYDNKIALTFEDSYMGDQVDDIFERACNAVKIWCEPSTQNGIGSATFYTKNDKFLSEYDFQDLCKQIQRIWYSNHGVKSKVLSDIKKWLKTNVLSQ